MYPLLDLIALRILNINMPTLQLIAIESQSLLLLLTTLEHNMTIPHQPPTILIPRQLHFVHFQTREEVLHLFFGGCVREARNKHLSYLLGFCCSFCFFGFLFFYLFLFLFLFLFQFFLFFSLFGFLFLPLFLFLFFIQFF